MEVADYTALDLSDEQRGTVDRIRQDLRRKQCDLMAARKQMEAALTPEQRRQLRRGRPR